MMGRDLSRVVLEGVPPLYSAAQNGDPHGALVAMRRILTQLREVDPELAEQVKARLPAAQAGLTGAGMSVRQVTPRTPSTAPRDPESRADLLKEIDTTNAMQPVIGTNEAGWVDTFLHEQRQAELLERHGLSPRSTLFLVGPPGVGKTMTAAWLARQLGVPLFQVEISSLISSYLGRTGQNLREVFDFARENRAVILLDEFDAIAKRRDDQADLGEVRRVVSVLLKEIEEWPGPSVLVAATNHPEIIDPAVFRRFQMTIRVDPPGVEQAKEILRLHLGSEVISEKVLHLAARLLAGSSGSDIRNVALESRRAAALEPEISLDEAILRALGKRAKSPSTRKLFAQTAKATVKTASLSLIARWLDVTKGTVHNYLNEGEDSR
ncbi:AAA family ATPase [Corallococcus coralloides]|uniref:AAA family ATPase n=1 Tax=Corallococcus coralloides TaxID=184914 RepID=UPI00384D59DD